MLTSQRIAFARQQRDFTSELHARYVCRGCRTSRYPSMGTLTIPGLEGVYCHACRDEIEARSWERREGSKFGRLVIVGWLVCLASLAGLHAIGVL